MIFDLRQLIRWSKKTKDKNKEIKSGKMQRNIITSTTHSHSTSIKSIRWPIWLNTHHEL
jgi:hypothetical protein